MKHINRLLSNVSGNYFLLPKNSLLSNLINTSSKHKKILQKVSSKELMTINYNRSFKIQIKMINKMLKIY